MTTTAAVSAPTDEALLLTIEQCAALTNTNRRAIYTLFNEGRLPLIKIGRLTRVRRSDLETFVASLTGEVGGSRRVSSSSSIRNRNAC